jgi:hypothetical protein
MSHTLARIPSKSIGVSDWLLALAMAVLPGLVAFGLLEWIVAP